jgi:hypothetical protein
MAGVGNLLVLLLACLAAGAISHYGGRRSERMRIFRKYGVRAGSELRSVRRVERGLRRDLHLPHLHPNPANAPRQHRARAVR